MGEVIHDSLTCIASFEFETRYPDTLLEDAGMCKKMILTPPCTMYKLQPMYCANS